MVLSVPSRRLALAHSSHRYAEASAAARLLRRNSRTDLAVRALAVSARRCSLAPSSLRKLLHSPPLIVPKSPLYSKQKTENKNQGEEAKWGLCRSVTPPLPYFAAGVLLAG